MMACLDWLMMMRMDPDFRRLLHTARSLVLCSLARAVP